MFDNEHNRPMRLAIVVDRYAPEARSAAHLFEDLARELTRRGHDVHVLTKYPVENLPDSAEAPPRKEVRDGARVDRLSSPLGEPRATWLKGVDQAFFAVRVFLRLLFRHRPDVVLVYSPPLLLAGACCFAGLLIGLPVAVNLHDLYPRTAIELGRMRSPVLIAFARQLERFVYSRAGVLIVPARESAEYLVRQAGIPESKVHLVYNWVAPDTRGRELDGGFRSAAQLDGKFVITYAGVVGLAQDLSAVIDAARRAVDDSELLFLVIGEGPTLQRWKVEGAGLPNLRFLPTLARERYIEALHASDVGLVALSADLRSPAIPAKLQNIMSVGCPVLAVVPDGSAAARVVKDAACGLVTKPGDGAALLQAVALMRSDPQLRRRLADAGRRYADRHFGLPSAIDSFEAALSSTLPRPARSQEASDLSIGGQGEL